MSEPTDLTELRAMLSDLEASIPGAAESIGLLLSARLSPSGYNQTPDNCLAFAYTGGDGVHYSFADVGEGISNASPIVMTVPMQFDRPNVIVGRTLRDFLSLGLRVGYFVLEELQYRREKMIALLNERRYRETMGESEIVVLSQIETHFDLEPWADYQKRLDELHQMFGSRILEN